MTHTSSSRGQRSELPHVKPQDAITEGAVFVPVPSPTTSHVGTWRSDVNDADPAWSASGEPISHLRNIRRTTRPLLRDPREPSGSCDPARRLAELQEVSRPSPGALIGFGACHEVEHVVGVGGPSPPVLEEPP
jgi:hypothetical protein